MSDAIAYATIRELGARYRKRELSPVEVTRALLARIEKLDPALHAFVTLTPDRALADARAAEEALRRGDERPLLGIPVGHKDIYLTKGIRTTGGSALFADWVPDSDSTVGRRWQDAGTVLLGKLITHEFAFGLQFPGHRFQPARNPWNLEHIPGGSSSGSGAALAAGLLHGATGSDTGGSIRGPAAFCGITGLKPTYGRVSRAGVMTLSWTLDHTGPMARTVEDCAYLLQAIAGHDAADPASSTRPVDDYVGALDGSVRGLRIGVPRNYFFEDADTDNVRAFEDALGTLRKLGADVRDLQIPAFNLSRSFMLIMLSEAFAYHEQDLRLHPELYGEMLRERLLTGALVTGPEYVQAQRVRMQICADVAEVMKTVDVLATPTTPKTAPTFKTMYDPELAFPRTNMPPFNLTGQPTLALPCGLSASGLPLSLQLSGRAFEEATVLRLGHAYQRATDWHTRRPPV
ncbi:MAG: Asp-tRNA(Asn)/Glu-tRNA(Gln) amidotransferase GatCAB subunit A [Candidatus Rokuibacteriota bacterium]|nr:MAG: Asp-tRNA(Asn)/Glu-tRNA(Gln) amidotransferase GatCAB subunit A [Candidatus Rokubacteria bacterium]